MEIDNYCMNCFGELKNGCICEHCGYDNDTQADMMYIPPKTVLADRYVIGAVQSHDSDAVTYIAYDTQLDTVVNVREFLPKGIANRLEGNLDVHIRERYKASYDVYKASFINLWQTIIKMRSLSAVIPTYDVFELNGTAYAVSDNMEYITLREFLLRNPDGNIMWEQARLMFMPVLTTLEALHANGIIHGGICPDNLVLCRDGKVRLKSFCITEANISSSALEFNANEGYTALEQYDNKHKPCPATDIYAFSACIFRALVGQNPPDAKSREANDKLMIPNTIAENIPTHVIRALGGGLQIYPEKRTQSINTFREMLNVSPTVVAAASQDAKAGERANQPAQPEKQEYKAPEKQKTSASKVVIIILVILIVIAAGAGVAIAKNGGFGNNEQSTEPTVQLASYTVPDFISQGFTQSDIQNNGAWNKQFKITYDAEYSADVAEGLVFKQSVAKGETVDEGTEIVLTVSKGVKTEVLPDVGGLTLEDATKTLEKLGFKVSTVEVYNDGGHTKGTIKSSYGSAPMAGEKVAVGEEIILQVYGEEITTTAPAEDASEIAPE